MIQFAMAIALIATPFLHLQSDNPFEQRNFNETKSPYRKIFTEPSI